MSYPTPYIPATDFSQLTEFDKSLLDPELDALAALSAAIDMFTRVTHRDDGQLTDKVVTFEALSEPVRNLLTGLGRDPSIGAAYVRTLQGLFGNVTLAGANGLTVTVTENTITLTAPALTSQLVQKLNNLQGAITLAAGAGVATITVTGNTITIPLDFASQVEAEAGTAVAKVMSALRVKQAIAAQVGSSVARLNATQTFTRAQTTAPFVVPPSTSIDTDAAQSNLFLLGLTANSTLNNPSNLQPGQAITYRVKQDATGNRSLTFGTVFKFPSGVAPVLTTVANAVDVISGFVNDDSNILCAFYKDVR